MALLSLMAFGTLFCGYEVQDTCGKMRDVQKGICRESESENCFPCVCILKGEDWEWELNGFGLPDFTTARCTKPSPCEGQKLEDAEDCMVNENRCDPRYYHEIKMFDQGRGEPGFEEVCGSWWQ